MSMGKITSDFAMLIKLCSIIVFRPERDVILLKKTVINLRLNIDVFIKYIYGVFYYMYDVVKENGDMRNLEHKIIRNSVDLKM